MTTSRSFLTNDTLDTFCATDEAHRSNKDNSSRLCFILLVSHIGCTHYYAKVHFFFRFCAPCSQIISSRMLRALHNAGRCRWPSTPMPHRMRPPVVEVKLLCRTTRYSHNNISNNTIVQSIFRRRTTERLESYDPSLSVVPSVLSQPSVAIGHPPQNNGQLFWTIQLELGRNADHCLTGQGRVAACWQRTAKVRKNR